MKIVKFLLLMAAALVIGNLFVRGKAKSPESLPPRERISRSVDEINRKVPVMVDSEARLDRASAGQDGNRLIYHYTLVNYSSGQVSREQILSLRENVINDTCLHKDKFNVVVEFEYKSNDGALIEAIEVDPAKCGSIQAQASQAREPQVQTPQSQVRANPAPVSTFHCAGTYSKNEGGQNLNEYPISGVVIELNNKEVKISGAAQFDSRYVVVTENDNGVGFQKVDDDSIGGFLNRFSRQLSVTQRIGAIKSDRSFTVGAILNATCQPANPMF